MSVESTSEVSLKLDSDIPIQSISDSHKTARQLAFKDVSDGLKKWRVWLLLAYQDIKLRYRRSALGPFWISISMAVTVYSMGFLYGHLFRTNLHEYFPFLAAGLIGWSLISISIMDLSEAFIASENLIKQIKLPYTLYIHRVAFRNFIAFFHNLIVMVPVIISFYPMATVNFYTLLLLPSLIIIYINAFCYGTILALIGARYRDVPQIIKSVIQVIFFITPVIWNPLILPEKYQSLALFNPFYAFVQLIRAPLVGTMPSVPVCLIALAATVIGIVASWMLFVKYRARIVYWL